MIIKINPNLDTYVTNLKVDNNDGSLSNLGKASTLDLFKIKSKSAKVKARALLKLSDLPSNSNTFTIRESTNNNEDAGTTFEFISGENSGGGLNGNNVKIGLGATPYNMTELIDNIISVVNSYDTANFKITASKLNIDTVLFTQDNKGASGEKNNSKSGSNISITNFTLFEHSVILLNFPIASFKSQNVNTLNKSTFATSSNFKASIVLKDVGKSNTKPKDFKVNIKPLVHNFIEGIGSDTLYFSDTGETNFVNIDTKNSLAWENQDIVSSGDTFSTTNYTSTDFEFKTGDEDLVFDITSFIHDELSGTPRGNFVISIDNDNLFDSYTYFVKRFGSNQIRNKYNSPYLEIKIKDDDIQYFNNKSKKRYLDNEEVFYLKNIINNKLTGFLTSDTIKFKITFLDSSGNDLLNIAPTLAGENNKVYDYTGKEINGIKRFIIANNILSRTNSNFISSITKNGYVSIKLKYYYNEETTIKEETVKFYIPDTESEVSTNNIRVAINLQQQNLYANNTIEFLKVSFIDIEKQHNSVKVPVDIASQNMGDVYYEMYDIDTGEKLIEYKDAEKEYTKLYYNGDDYILNLYCSEQYKNRRVSFTFIFTDSFAGKQKHINDLNQVIRFK